MISASVRDVTIDAIAQLRERNQLTLPEPIAVALKAGAGDDLVFTVEEAAPGVARMQLLPRSYAGIAGDLYGKTADERNAYIAEERASWDDDDPGRAPDGTRYLTFEQSKRTYRQTQVTRERYQREPKLRWPKCEVCGRSIAKMVEHRSKHKRKVIDDRGVSHDPDQVARSRRRVRKWREARARRTPGTSR